MNTAGPYGPSGGERVKVSDVPLEALGCSQPNGVLPEKISYFVDEDAFLFKENPQKVRKNPKSFQFQKACARYFECVTDPC